MTKITQQNFTEKKGLKRLLFFVSQAMLPFKTQFLENTALDKKELYNYKEAR